MGGLKARLPIHIDAGSEPAPGAVILPSEPWRLLILDIDGVLNRYGASTTQVQVYDDSPDAVVEPACIERVGEILAATGAYVLWCSTWRLHYRAYLPTLLPSLGVPAKTVGVTADRVASERPGNDPFARFKQIQTWLQKFPAPQPSRMVVLDDDRIRRAEKFQVKIDGEHGLRAVDVAEAIQRLK